MNELQTPLLSDDGGIFKVDYGDHKVSAQTRPVFSEVTSETSSTETH